MKRLLLASTLLWTLAQGLGPAFTPEVHDAWVAVYGVLAEQMQLGMQEASLPAAA